MLFIRGRITKRKGIDDEDTAADMLVMHYRIPYESNIDSMLHFLLVKVSESHFNSEDSEILYKKIVRLFHKMDSQQGLKDLKESTNNFFNDFISTSG